jgi:hypothetical protein
MSAAPTPTTEQLDQLLAEACAAGDYAMAGICCAALDYEDVHGLVPLAATWEAMAAFREHTRNSALAECGRVIAEAGAVR